MRQFLRHDPPKLASAEFRLASEGGPQLYLRSAFALAILGRFGGSSHVWA
jgi:hypothetical protein